MSLQDKMQITVPYHKKEDDGNEWADAKSVRIQKVAEDRLNKMPVGMNQNLTPFAKGFGGDTDVSGGDVTPKSLQKGYARHDMNGTDDLYSGEHVDLFYGEAVDENGKSGFIERNNYMDRS